MHRGLYAAASAMIVQETMHDVTANNLANVSSSGFRKRIPVNKSFPEVLMDRVEKPSEDGSIKLVSAPFQLGFKGKFLIGDLSLANVMSETYMSTEEGAIQVTDAPLDAAILGEGYFTVQDGAGSLFYTRSGHFQRSAEGSLSPMTEWQCSAKAALWSSATRPKCPSAGEVRSSRTGKSSTCSRWDLPQPHLPPPGGPDHPGGHGEFRGSRSP